ncbi:uncharacterized protein LOC144119014 [Amblyomma americanum]
MSITMVGPYPGPFDRTHYSDSSSESHKDRSQGRPRPAAPSKPRSQPWTPDRSSQPVPHESVAYSQSSSAAALGPAHASATHPQPSPSQPLSPKPQIEAIKRRCNELLWQLGAFALVAAVVAVLVVVVLSRAKVHPGAARLKGANVVSGANATRVNGLASLSTPTSVPAADAELPGGHNTNGINRRPRQKPRRHRGGAKSRRGLPKTSAALQRTPLATSGQEARPRATPKTTSSAGDDQEAMTASHTWSDPTSPAP